MSDKKKVLFLSFEGLPFVKTGGLADVIYALPKAIDNKQYEVRVILPLHKFIKSNWFDKLDYLGSIEVKTTGIDEKGKIYNLVNEGIEYFFIQNDSLYEREGIYGFSDDAKRFCFFNMAVVEMMKKIGYYPDIIHSHDYHTGIISLICKIKYFEDEKIRNIKQVYTIHNLAYQGVYSKAEIFNLLDLDERLWLDGSISFKGKINFMKVALTFADKITTVSQTYADEVLWQNKGEGLEDVIRYRRDDFMGILNGIDTDLFNPLKDKEIINYSQKNFVSGKAKNKERLQKELGLEVNTKKFLVGIISRLTWQKGIDLIAQSFDWMMKNKDVQFVVLGNGEKPYEKLFEDAMKKYPGRVYYCDEFNDPLSHKMYAGLDLFLMPSLFEPCGISQLIAMRYGTLPLVRETGGLRDTVIPYNEYTKEGNGYSFGPYDSQSLRIVFDYAYKTYRLHRKDFNGIIKNAMKCDVSFTSSARKYEGLYKSL